MNRTGIEYLDWSWNPVAMRCTPVSDGCKNCWHLAMARRHAANPTLRREVREARAGGKPWLDVKELEAPLHLRKPARIGLEFMGDLFHQSVTTAMRDRVFDVMWRSPQHTFVVLTKRPARMVDYVRGRASVRDFGWAER